MSDQETPTAEKLLNIGDKAYQYTWKDFEGEIIEREVECVIYYEHPKPEDCFYRYAFKGICFFQENQVYNRQLGSKWFATRESAQAALDKELSEKKAVYAANLKKEIEKSQKELDELSSPPTT